MNRFYVASTLALMIAALYAGHDRLSAAEPPHGTIVVSNMQDNTATVIDAATGAVLRTLPTGEGPHEVAASRDGRWAVVSNYGVRGRAGNTISVIDLDRLEVARTIDLGTYHRPHGMKFLRGDSVLAVTSEESQTVVLVSFHDGRVIAAVPTRGRGSHMLTVPDGDTTLFTTNVVDGSISQLDLATRTNTRVIPVAKRVEGITVTPDGRSVWVGSNGDSVVVVVNASTGQPTDTLRGFGMPYRLAASPDGRSIVVTDPVRAEIRIFDVASRRERFLIHVPHDSVLATAEVPGSPAPEGVTISYDSQWAFVTLQGRNRLATIDLSTGRIVGYAPTGAGSDGIAYSPHKR